MALTQSGLMGNSSHYGMMGAQQVYPHMMGGQQGYPGMMGGNQQTPAQQGTPVTGVTRVTIQNFAYQRANIQVRVGTTVTWTNQDKVPHSITFKNGTKDSGLLTYGKSFRYTFTAPGTYHYYCTVHPYMVGTVIVVS